VEGRLETQRVDVDCGGWGMVSDDEEIRGFMFAFLACFHTASSEVIVRFNSSEKRVLYVTSKRPRIMLSLKHAVLFKLT